MNTRNHHRLTNVNRVLIFTLTLAGMVMDGIRFADVLCTVALFLWLWLPMCTRQEVHLLRWLEEKRTPGSASDGPGSPSGLPYRKFQTRNQT